MLFALGGGEGYERPCACRALGDGRKQAADTMNHILQIDDCIAIKPCMLHSEFGHQDAAVYPWLYSVRAYPASANISPPFYLGLSSAKSVFDAAVVT